jgi:hypothetical protein
MLTSTPNINPKPLPLRRNCVAITRSYTIYQSTSAPNTCKIQQKRTKAGISIPNCTDMFPKFACNLIATISHPPWTEELDWSLHTNFDWEKRVPFYAYVQPSRVAPRATEQGSLFPKFGALPIELQLHILALCPANTLVLTVWCDSPIHGKGAIELEVGVVLLQDWV